MPLLIGTQGQILYFTVHYVCMLGQCSEPQGRCFTGFHYYYSTAILWLLNTRNVSVATLPSLSQVHHRCEDVGNKDWPSGPQQRTPAWHYACPPRWQPESDPPASGGRPPPPLHPSPVTECKQVLLWPLTTGQPLCHQPGVHHNWPIFIQPARCSSQLANLYATSQVFITTGQSSYNQPRIITTGQSSTTRCSSQLAHLSTTSQVFITTGWSLYDQPGVHNWPIFIQPTRCSPNMMLTTKKHPRIQKY